MLLCCYACQTVDRFKLKFICFVFQLRATFIIIYVELDSIVQLAHGPCVTKTSFKRLTYIKRDFTRPGHLGELERMEMD